MLLRCVPASTRAPTRILIGAVLRYGEAVEPANAWEGDSKLREALALYEKYVELAAVGERAVLNRLASATAERSRVEHTTMYRLSDTNADDLHHLDASALFRIRALSHTENLYRCGC